MTDGLSFRIFDDLHANSPGSRAELERRLQTDLAALTDKSDLVAPPRYSISHCPLASGYAIASSPHIGAVGFDLEELHRISRPIVERVSTPEELQAAPDFRALWVAKEAAFKALNRKGKMTVMTEARILDWKIKDKTDYFSVFLPTGQQIPGEGFFHISGGLILGIFWAKP